jgi:Tfp pilus assembly protein PilO
VQVKAKNALLSAVVVLLVGALWYKVVYSPMESKASKAKTAAEAADQTAANLQTRISAVTAAQKKAKSHEVASRVLLAAVPAQAAEATFLRAIDALRISSGADWQSITPGVPVLTGTLTTINVAITVQGTEAQLRSYQNGLYDLKRIFLVDGLSISVGGSSPAPGAVPHASGGVFSADQLQMQITGRIFSQPGAVGTTGATGASGAAAATKPATGAAAPPGA